MDYGCSVGLAEFEVTIPSMYSNATIRRSAVPGQWRLMPVCRSTSSISSFRVIRKRLATLIAHERACDARYSKDWEGSRAAFLFVECDIAITLSPTTRHSPLTTHHYSFHALLLTSSALGKSFGTGRVTLPVAAHSAPRCSVVMKPTHSCESLPWPIGV